jgi:hypothetical protein
MSNIYNILVYGEVNKIFFILEKLEIIYLTTKQGDYILLYIVNNTLTINLIITAPKVGN